MHYLKLYEGHQHLFLQASSLDSFVENISQYLQTKFERQSLCFNIVTSKPRLFQWFLHMYVWQNPKWTVLPASACYSQRGEWAAFTLSCSHSFGLILNISGSKTETRKAKFSCFTFVCNLQMLFLPFQKTDKKKKKPILIFVGCGSCLSLTGVVFIN